MLFGEIWEGGKVNLYYKLFFFIICLSGIFFGVVGVCLGEVVV